MENTISRRRFIEKSSLATAAATLGLSSTLNALGSAPVEPKLNIHVFSKHLQFLSYQETAEAAAEIGFDGVDWAVRPKGHILPEKVEEDLPKAIAALKKVNMAPLMMTSGITSLEAEHTRTVLQTAAENGIEYYRLGYYRFDENVVIPDDLQVMKAQIEDLAKFNKSIGIQGAFQNHAGRFVGASMWEIHQLIKDTDTESMGCQYDIRHASVDGAESWRTGLRLIEPRINSIVLKDYRWKKEGDAWKLLNVPIGEGMVDFIAYFKLLKKYKISVPVSMHYEYDLGGAEHGERNISIPQKEVFATMKRDLLKVKELWKNA